MRARMAGTLVLLASLGLAAVVVNAGRSGDQPGAAPVASRPPTVRPVPVRPAPIHTAPVRPAATRGPSLPPRPTPRSTRPPAEPHRRLLVFRIIDGDTVAVGALHVRVLGIDTPESGDCGFATASMFTARFLARGGWLAHRSGYDRYGRALAYVVNAPGKDLGAALIRHGLANARYDSTDGYDWHPREAQYHRLDQITPHICGRGADALGGP